MEQLSSHWKNFHEILKLSIFPKIYPENSTFIKILQEQQVLRKDQYTFLSYLGQLFLRMRNIADKSCRENQKHILLSISFSPKIVQLMR